MKKIILITKTALEKIPPVISDLHILLDLGYRPSLIVTGISDGLNSKTLPIVGLAATVVMLGVSALMLKRRRRS